MNMDRGRGDAQEILLKGLEELKRRENPVSGYSAGFIDALEKFLDELEMWNRRVRLVSGDRRDIVVRHLLDSLAVYPVIRALAGENPENAVIADAGSGNGFPAVPLALRDENLRFSLVERSAKKAAFLRNAVGILGLAGRIEVLDRDLREVDRQFSLVISRAFMPLSGAVPLIRGTIGKEGVLIFLAGRRTTIDGEISILEKHTGKAVKAEILPVEVPFLPEERHVCLFRP